jgi:hypothetical protein
MLFVGVHADALAQTKLPVADFGHNKASEKIEDIRPLHSVRYERKELL